MGYWDNVFFIPVDFCIHRERGQNKEKPFGLKKKELKKQFRKNRKKDTCTYERALMSQKKNRFKRLEHPTFIDWFISVPAKITRSGHQMEIKLYSLSRESGNIIFIKPTGKSLTSSLMRR
jgi:hypothetical protein